MTLFHLDIAEMIRNVNRNAQRHQRHVRPRPHRHGEFGPGRLTKHSNRGDYYRQHAHHFSSIDNQEAEDSNQLFHNVPGGSRLAGGCVRDASGSGVSSDGWV